MQKKRPISIDRFRDESSEAYTYDANNNNLIFKTRNGDTSADIITKTYDVLNRLSTRQPGALALQTTTYDLAGRPLSISTPVDDSNPASGTYGYSYDTAGRLLVQTMPNGDTVTYQLDQNGNRTKLIWPDDYYADYVFDELNRLTDIKLNGAATSSIGLEYDVLSRRTLTSYANGCTCAYEYALNNDMTHQNLAFVGSAVNFKYFYNRVHQIIGLIPDDFSYFWTPSSSSTNSYDTANDLNQYPAVDGTSFTYNGNGCLTGGPQTANFDVLNRITQIVSGSITNDCWIDPLNRQAQKSVNGTKTQYLYDGSQIIADYDGSGTLQNRYIRAGLDEALIQVAGSTLTYNHMDRQCSTIAQTDGSGAVLNKYTYSPFGETTSLSGTIFGYTGQRYDSEIGLYNYKARYYDPAIGRFLQPDPIGYVGGDLNLYSYVGNDAANMADPSGMFYLTENLQLILAYLAGLANKNAAGGGGMPASAGPLNTAPPAPNLLNPLDWFMQPAYAETPSITPAQRISQQAQALYQSAKQKGSPENSRLQNRDGQHFCNVYVDDVLKAVGLFSANPNSSPNVRGIQQMLAHDPRFVRVPSTAGFQPGDITLWFDPKNSVNDHSAIVTSIGKEGAVVSYAGAAGMGTASLNSLPISYYPSLPTYVYRAK